MTDIDSPRSRVNKDYEELQRLEQDINKKLKSLCKNVNIYYKEEHSKKKDSLKVDKSTQT